MSLSYSESNALYEARNAAQTTSRNTDTLIALMREQIAWSEKIYGALTRSRLSGPEFDIFQKRPTDP